MQHFYQRLIETFGKPQTQTNQVPTNIDESWKNNNPRKCYFNHYEVSVSGGEIDNISQHKKEVHCDEYSKLLDLFRSNTNKKFSMSYNDNLRLFFKAKNIYCSGEPEYVTCETLPNHKTRMIIFETDGRFDDYDIFIAKY